MKGKSQWLSLAIFVLATGLTLVFFVKEINKDSAAPAGDSSATQ